MVGRPIFLPFCSFFLFAYQDKFGEVSDVSVFLYLLVFTVLEMLVALKPQEVFVSLSVCWKST